MVRLTSAVVSVLAYCIVIYIILYFNPTEDETAVKAIISNSAARDVAVCWGSAYDREHEIVARSPEGCYRVNANSQMLMNTYSGHRFVILPYEKSDLQDYWFISIKKDTTNYEVGFKVEVGYDDMTWSDIWSEVLRRRHVITMTIASVYLVMLHLPLFPSTAHPEETEQKQYPPIPKQDKIRTYLAIPRQSLKCLAVILMLLNHVTYLLYQDTPSVLLVGTIPADLGGSSAIFSFLVGYNTSLQSTRANTTILIVVFMLLEQWVRLPRPFVYEYLFTYAVARSFLSTSMLRVEHVTGLPSCRLASYPIWVHAGLICILISSNGLFNAEGIRLMQNTGLLLAILGRLFVTCRQVEIRFLWALSASLFMLKNTWHKLSTADVNSPIEMTVGVVCVMGLCLETILFTIPVAREQVLWKHSRISSFLSRYSLEIYVSHLVLFYAYCELFK